MFVKLTIYDSGVFEHGGYRIITMLMAQMTQNQCNSGTHQNSSMHYVPTQRLFHQQNMGFINTVQPY